MRQRDCVRCWFCFTGWVDEWLGGAYGNEGVEEASLRRRVDANRRVIPLALHFHFRHQPWHLSTNIFYFYFFIHRMRPI